MRGIIGLLVLCLCVISDGAKADQNVVINCQIGTTSTGAPIVAPASAANPCPVLATITDTITVSSLSPYIITPLGQQTITLTSSAQSLTVPATATIADFYPEGTGGTNGNCMRFRDDGTAPTATVGAPLQPGQLLLGYTGKPAAGAALSGIQFILATGAVCTLTINYYK